MTFHIILDKSKPMKPITTVEVELLAENNLFVGCVNREGEFSAKLFSKKPLLQRLVWRARTYAGH